MTSVTSTGARPRTRPDVVAFDVNETLLDLAPVRAALAELGEPEHLLPAVFGRTLLTGFAATIAGSWCAFRDAFDAALAQISDLSAADRARVADAFGELVPHDDVEPALRRLAEAGVRAVTLSHGSPGVADAGLARGGVAGLVERTLSSESIRAWKANAEHRIAQARGKSDWYSDYKVRVAKIEYEYGFALREDPRPA